MVDCIVEEIERLDAVIQGHKQNSFRIRNRRQPRSSRRPTRLQLAEVVEVVWWNVLLRISHFHNPQFARTSKIRCARNDRRPRHSRHLIIL